MSPLWAIAASLITAIVTGSVAWLIAARKTSGKVETSEASTLWDESRAIRLELRGEVQALRTEVVLLRSTLEEVRKEAVVYRTEATLLREQLAQLKGRLVVEKRRKK